MLWHLQIDPAAGRADRDGVRIAAEAAELGLTGPWRIASSRGFLIEGPINGDEVRRAAETVLVDRVVESYAVQPCPHDPQGAGHVVHVLPKPGVMDPEAQSALDIL